MESFYERVIEFATNHEEYKKLFNFEFFEGVETFTVKYNNLNKKVEVCDFLMDHTTLTFDADFSTEFDYLSKLAKKCANGKVCFCALCFKKTTFCRFCNTDLYYNITVTKNDFMSSVYVENEYQIPYAEVIGELQDTVKRIN